MKIIRSNDSVNIITTDKIIEKVLEMNNFINFFKNTEKDSITAIVAAEAYRRQLKFEIDSLDLTDLLVAIDTITNIYIFYYDESGYAQDIEIAKKFNDSIYQIQMLIVKLNEYYEYDTEKSDDEIEFELENLIIGISKKFLETLVEYATNYYGIKILNRVIKIKKQKEI